ncbi:MAG TPA: NADH-quinone oxidoreductase subunit C [Ignavibacteria bacterium]|nr:NADH-quinone oxidoreductase subunit C [Ignavibacteria bacterium]
MTNEELKNKIISVFPEAEYTEEGTQYLNVISNPDKFRSLAEFLRNNDEMSFDFLFCLTGVDWVTNLMVIYHLESTKNKHTIVLKVKITDRENPAVETVSDIWRTAEFHEREVFDLFGVKFINHPDLRRLLLEDDWIGYPLRKDYKDEANIVEL